MNRILHLSDFHYDSAYTPGLSNDCGEPLCCRPPNQNGILTIIARLQLVHVKHMHAVVMCLLTTCNNNVALIAHFSIELSEYKIKVELPLKSP